MTSIALVCRRIDSFCARLNDGLAAVAIFLAILTTILSVGRHPDIFLPQGMDAEASPAVDLF
jgi:hypothetical protein